MLHFRSPEIGMFGRRQRHERGHRIAVSIVGDATVPGDSDTIVLRDSFGARDTASLPGGCACCTVRVELQAALRRVSNERRHVSRLVIETREELGPILRTFASERALGGDFCVEDFPAEAFSMPDIRRFTLNESVPLQWNAFSRFTATLMALRGADLLHVKGLLDIAGCRGPVAVQFVQHLASAPIELQAWPDQSRASRVDFITRGIDEKTARDLFDAVRAFA
jgi:G3E family GTPase